MKRSRSLREFRNYDKLRNKRRVKYDSTSSDEDIVPNLNEPKTKTKSTETKSTTTPTKSLSPKATTTPPKADNISTSKATTSPKVESLAHQIRNPDPTYFQFVTNKAKSNFIISEYLIAN